MESAPTEPIKVSERSTLEINRDLYYELDEHPDVRDLIGAGIVQLVRSKSTPYGLRAGPYVGQANLGSVGRIIVEPKVTDALGSLLRWSVPNDVRVEQLSSMIAPDSPVLEVFAARFLEALKGYLSEGRARRYFSHSRSGSVPRGRVDISRTAALEARGRHGVLTYQIQRLSADIALNQFLGLALLAVEEFVKSSGTSPELLARARAYAALFEDVAWRSYRRKSKSETKVLFERALDDASTEHSRKALLYGRALLFNLGAWPADDSASMTVPNSFFLSLETLFEDALRNALNANPGFAAIKGSDLGLPLFNSRPSRYIANPDIVLTSEAPCIALDAKFRDLGGGLPSHDAVFQLQSHAGTVRASACALIYPMDEGPGDASWWLSELGATRYGLRVFYGEVDLARIFDGVSGFVKELIAELPAGAGGATVEAG